ncbi:MAG: general secretion pathway protein GspK [Candidatus Omnitrophica bacterium]|nr:general secretion pathway protein GspK [Candidatus Omnitrophota bacterium]
MKEFLYNNKKSKASILILVLWTLCLLTSFAVILGFAVRQKLTLVNRLEERDTLRFIAEAAIKKVIAYLKEEPEKNYDALKDNWSNNPAIFKQINIGGGNASILYNYIDEDSGMAELRYGLIDEESKININKISQPILERLFRLVGLDEIQAQELAAAVIDWRDSDSELSLPIGSAEDAYYRNLKYPYEAKDADFEVLEEVLLVKGMDENIFTKIKNYITIYGDGKININTASRVVLLALGLNQDLVEKIISFRLGEDEIISTSDDNIFEVPSNIVPKLSQFSHLSDSEIAQLSVIVEKYLVTNSRNFMVRCISKLEGRKKTAEMISVVDRFGKILYWQES